MNCTASMRRAGGLRRTSTIARNELAACARPELIALAHAQRNEQDDRHRRAPRSPPRSAAVARGSAALFTSCVAANAGSRPSVKAALRVPKTRLRSW